MRPDGTGTEQLTTGLAVDNDPSWSPDGRAIAFSRDDGSGRPQVYVVVLDTGEATQITDAAGGARFPDWR
jgi:TolB protein